MSDRAVRADLRSDTLTRPTEAMRQAMAQAAVGDDVFGEDPTVVELETRVAGLLGHEAALFTPSGSMAGQLAVRAHVEPGQELITDDQAHVLRAEMGAAAAISGIASRTWAADHGLLEPDRVRRLMSPPAGPYQVSTACVVIENTHNFGGGTVQPLQAMQQVRELTREAGVAVQVDGARIWNAHIASGVSLTDYGACADTVSVCLSKGLGAPVGSLLVGSTATVEAARVWRKRLGGGMRQVGILAAAGLYALDHHVDRLAEDHARAQRVAQAVAGVDETVVDPAWVHTNILILDVSARGWSAPDFADAAAERGILGFALDASHVRYVWHLDVDDAMTDHASQVLLDLLAD